MNFQFIGLVLVFFGLHEIEPKFAPSRRFVLWCVLAAGYLGTLGLIWINSTGLSWT